MRKLCTTSIVSFGLLCGFGSFGQTIDLGALKGGSNKVKVSGGLNGNVVYTASQAANIPPLSLFLSGNINVSYRNFNLPLSVNYSNRKFTYSQPFSFNFVTFRPSYKWILAEIGTCFMSFSPYSLSGHQFQGVGLTLTPKRWSVSAMYGRLFKATDGNPELQQLPIYRRMGMGIKTVYKSDHFTLGLSLFNAADKPTSLAHLSESLRPQPKENMVVGLEFSTMLFRKLEVSAAYHSSSLNADTNQPDSNGVAHQKSLSGWLLNKSSMVQSYNSYRFGMNYNLSKSNGIIGIEYQKVDPDYMTLGGYYFVNDFENLTLKYYQSLWSGKVNLSGSLGLQQDDIARQKSSGQRRVVGMMNLMLSPSQRLNAGLTFSNFTSYSFVRTAFDEIRKLNPFEQLDTLNYRHINQNISVFVNYTLSQTETRVQSININVSQMQSVAKQGDVVRVGQQSGFVNSDITYNYQLPQKAQSIGVGVNTSFNAIGTQNSFSVGPLFHVQKGFLQNKLTTNTALSYVYSKDATLETSAGAFNLRESAQYNWDKKNSLSANLGFTQVSGSTLAGRTYVSATVGYINRF
ncbi:MAG: hypothetical protein LCH91_28495 [Bacteroidetes bacterium]|nr:hypothetical protein [Bacteroidota bacterium]